MENLGVVLENPKHEIKSFGFNSFSWHEIPTQKLNVISLKLFLDENVNLSDYGTGIKKIYFGFIAYPKGMELFAKDKEEIEFLEDRKIVCITYPTDYEKLLNATEAEGQAQLQETYLEGLKKVLPSMGIIDFDVTRFLVDLEKILMKR